MSQLDLYNYIKRKREEGYSWDNILKFMIKDKRVHNKANILDIKALYQDISGRQAVGDVIQEDGSSYDDAFEQFKLFIGKTTNYFEPLKSNNNVDERKIVCISDPHIPFMDEEKFYHICEKEGGPDVTLVFNGDYLNGDSLSTHAKFRLDDFQKEVAEGRLKAEYARSKFGKVYFLLDNHVDARWKRHLGNDIRPDLHFLMEHPYDYMLKGLDIIRAENTHEFKLGKEIGHCMMLGDILFSHGFISGKHLQSAVKIKEWHNKWRHIFNHPEARVVVHGHVHSLGLSYEGDTAYVQAGTLATLEGLAYSLGGECKGSPPQYGYTTFYQKNGITDLGKIGVYKL